MRIRKHDIERYLRGELSPAEMHALEKEALNDPFLAEALEGVEHAGKDNFLQDLHDLNRSLHSRTHHRKTKNVTIWGWSAGIAATLLLVVVSGFLVVTLVREQSARQLATSEEPSLFEKTTDTLTVIFPPQTIAKAEQLNPPTAARREGKLIEAPQTQRVPASETPLAEKDDAANGTGWLWAVPPPVTEVTEEEPVTVAEIGDADLTPTKEEEEVPQQNFSKVIQGRAAGVESRKAAGIARSSESRTITGKVTSAGDGEGLPGVSVAVKGTDVYGVTDVNGNYELLIPADNNTLVFSFIGFETREAQIRDQRELNVTLEEDIHALSEVVVVSGYGTTHESDDKPASFRPAEPKGGRNDFKDYLKRAVRYPREALSNKTEGRVTVRFTVEPTGQLTNFQVVRGIGSGCDEELIRAIKEGPSWQPGKQGDVPLADKVKVRFKFQLPE
jgi:TonB family protein